MGPSAAPGGPDHRGRAGRNRHRPRCRPCGDRERPIPLPPRAGGYPHERGAPAHRAGGPRGWQAPHGSLAERPDRARRAALRARHHRLRGRGHPRRPGRIDPARRGAPRAADARLHTSPARPARPARAPPARLRVHARARPRTLPGLRGTRQRDAARCGGPRRHGLRDRPRGARQRPRFHGPESQQHGRRRRPRLRDRVPRPRGHPRHALLAPHRGPHPLGHRRIRVRRVRGRVRDGIVDHAAEEESRRGRVDPRQDGAALRQPDGGPRDHERPAAHLQLGHAGRQGAAVRHRRHARGRPDRAAADALEPHVAGGPHARGRGRPLFDGHGPRRLPGPKGPAVPRRPRGGGQDRPLRARPRQGAGRVDARRASTLLADDRRRRARRDHARGVALRAGRHRRHGSGGRSAAARAGQGTGRMMGGASRARRRLVTLILTGVAFVACGKKGPPVTPESRLPLPASALRAHIDEDAVVVSWTNPRTRADGSALRDLTTVKLYRREEAEDSPLKPAMLSGSRVVGYEEIASMRLDTPTSAGGDGTQWIDRSAHLGGRRYVYVVTATDSTGRTGAPSERLAVPYLAPPRSPRDVQAVGGDQQVTLTWEPPTELADGAPIPGPLVYMVLRGTGSEGPLVSVTPAGVADTSYVDRGLDNDSEYRYAVRAVRVDPRVAAFGSPSAAVPAIPADTTPPSPPANLVVVPSPGALRLAWTASPEEDVALYAIYRATGTGGFLRIGSTLSGTTTFIDRDVRAGVTYRYAVTAIDRARKPNESGRSNEITIAAP